MINLGLLNKMLRDSGIKRAKLMEVMGLSYTSLKKKLDGEVDFKVTEAVQIKALLKMTNQDFMRVFLSNEVGNMPTGESDGE